MRRFAKGCGNVSLRFILAAIPLVAAFATETAPPDSNLKSNRGTAPDLNRNDPAESNRRGVALVEQGKLIEAEGIFRSALADCENCAALTSILNNLGEVYYATGRYSAAGPLYEKALVLREAQAGPDALVLLPVLNNLALLSRETADYGRALHFAERARSIVELHNATETAEGAAAFATLGEILQRQGDLEGARKWLNRALSIGESLFAPSDPRIAETLSDLALADRAESRFETAAKLYRKALAVLQAAKEGAARNDHRIQLAVLKKSGVVRSNLAQAEAEQGHLKEAEHIAHQSVAELERAYGPQHPSTAAGYVNLAKILRYRRRFDEAAQALLHAQAIDRQAFAPDHPRIANDLSLQAALAFDRKKYPEAEKLFQQSLAILTQRFPAPRSDIGRLSANLAEVYVREKRFTEAANAFDQALAILERALGPDNPELVPLMMHYSQILRAQQDFAKAASLDARVMKIRVTRTLKRAA
jgi:tetratricopeptide (TPR) repeat protein